MSESLVKTGSTKRFVPGVRETINVTGLDKEDMRVLYQAYRLETLPWKLPYELEPREVLAQVQDILTANYSFVWSVRDRAMPIFVVFANAIWGGIFLDAPIISARASDRQVYEGSIALIQQLKEEAPVLVSTEKEKKPFFERLQDHKILRRVGTLHDMAGRYLFQARR